MSWMQKLCQTYDYCTPLVGQVEAEGLPPLLPVAHTTQKAHIEVTVSPQGDFLRAGVIANKREGDTVIPCSEKSQNRGGIYPENYPLFDKLQYLAGDYTAFGGQKGEQFHEKYMADLRAWCASPEGNPRVKAVLAYLEKGTLMANLVAAGLFPLGEDGLPRHKWESRLGEKRGVFLAGSALPDALDAFVRLDVQTPGSDTPLWLDPEVWDSYIGYYARQQGEEDICYATGRVMPCSEMSPAKIRGTGDKAKLVSSNDSSGFTYRGRFETATQAVRIGYDTTQKAHNVLKWLIARQGFHCGDLCYVAWGTHDEKLPGYQLDTYGMGVKATADFPGEDFEASLLAGMEEPDVETHFARKLDQLLAGYRKSLTDRAEVVVMGLDSATTGRLSIVCYEELKGSELLDRVRSWHRSCAWPLRYLKRPEGAAKGSVFIGAPSPEDIVLAAYGKNVSDKLKKSAVRRIMPCILEQMPLPRDLMLCTARRASQPAALDAGEYVKTLCIACALIRKYYHDRGKEYTMALDKENQDRSYLFGRVLAYYNYIEGYMINEGDSSRLTNALRLKPYFSRHPKTTLGILDQKLSPYLRRLYSREDKLAGYYKGKMGELNGLLSTLDGDHCRNMTDDPLDETYLLGYASQMNEFYNGKKEGE